MDILIYYLIVINASGLLFMLADKIKAQKNQWRIPEATLMGIGLLGGSLGCILGMRLFRHKTKHPKFFVGLPVMLVAQMIILMVLYIKLR